MATARTTSTVVSSRSFCPCETPTTTFAHSEIVPATDRSMPPVMTTSI